MENYRFFNEIIIIGDNAKYLFAKEYIDEIQKYEYSIDIFQDKEVYILYSEKNSVEKNEDRIKIYSNDFPKSKIAIVLDDESKIANFENVKKVLMFTSFPYMKKDLLDNLKEYESNQLLSVLYKEDRKFASTDLSNENDIIEKAILEYKKNSIESFIYKQNEKSNKLFEIIPDFANILKSNYIKTYKEYEEEFDYIYEMVYEEIIGEYSNKLFGFEDINELEKFREIFSYSFIESSKDIWKSFVELFQARYLESEDGILNKSCKLYEEIIQDLAYWDLNKDKKNLENTIMKRYFDYFKNNTVLKAPQSEIDYKILLNKSKKNALHIIFSEKVKMFLDVELKIVLKQYLDDRLKNIKNIVGV